MSPYDTDAAFRSALEQRLLNFAQSKSVSLERLRRQVVLERLLARLDAAEPGEWVLKGAMALEVRIGLLARATMDVDLGLRSRERSIDLDALGERLTHVLSVSLDDRFVYRLADLRRLTAAGGGDLARARLESRLAGREFGRIQMDVVCRSHELADTERVQLGGHLRFAGIEPPTVEVVSLPRHAAEKFHAMLRQFSDRENTRVRDLADLVILAERGLIDPARTAAAVRQVFAERTTDLPSTLLPLPAGWPERYEKIAREHGIAAAEFGEATEVLVNFWRTMFPQIREDS
jgi:hypothetical protein